MTEIIYIFNKNTFKVQYSVDKKKDIVKNLNQKLDLKKQLKVQTEYNKKKDQTKVQIKPDKEKEDKTTLTGMWILEYTADRGTIGYISP